MEPNGADTPSEQGTDCSPHHHYTSLVGSRNEGKMFLRTKIDSRESGARVTGRMIDVPCELASQLNKTQGRGVSTLLGDTHWGTCLRGQSGFL